MFTATPPTEMYIVRATESDVSMPVLAHVTPTDAGMSLPSTPFAGTFPTNLISTASLSNSTEADTATTNISVPFALDLRVHEKIYAQWKNIQCMLVNAESSSATSLAAENIGNGSVILSTSRIIWYSNAFTFPSSRPNAEVQTHASSNFHLVYELDCNNLLFHALSNDNEPSSQQNSGNRGMILCQFSKVDSDDEDEDNSEEWNEVGNAQENETMSSTESVHIPIVSQNSSLFKMLSTSCQAFESLISTDAMEDPDLSSRIDVKFPLYRFDELRLLSEEKLSLTDVYSTLNDIVTNLNNNLDDTGDENEENTWFFAADA